MKRTLRVLIPFGVVLLLLGLFGAVAQGQDGPTITLSGDDITEGEGDDGPTYSVPEAGTYDVTIAGSGFSVDVFVLQCPGAAGSLEALEEGDPTALCDLGNLIPASPDDSGAFEVSASGVEIGDCGLVFAAGDAAATEAAAALLAVENPAADAECEVTEAAGYDEDEVAGTGQEGDEGDGELASTGVNSRELAAIAAAVLAVGGLALFQSRRLGTRGG